MSKRKNKKKRVLLKLGIALCCVILFFMIPSFIMVTTDTPIQVGGKDYNIGDISGYLGALFAKKTEQEKHYFNALRFERYVVGGMKAINSLFPEPKNIKNENDFISESFYRGNTVFENSPGSSWRMGYAQRSTVPSDLLEKAYRTGGNLVIPMIEVKSQLDETKVRVIALSDGEGRAVNVFAVIDCIGLSNNYIRSVRRGLTDFASEYNIGSINILSTHSHSAIDTMGIWSADSSQFFKNWFALIAGKDEIEKSVDEQYMNFLSAQIDSAIREAVQKMEDGKLYYSEIGANSISAIWDEIEDALGIDDNTEWNDELNDRWNEEWSKYSIERFGLANYIWNKRNPYDYSPKLLKLRFVPDNAESKQTLIANLAAHPYLNGLKYDGNNADALSGDYPNYMEQIVNESGANFLFVNGAINGIYTDKEAARMYGYNEENFNSRELAELSIPKANERLGEDLGRILLAMNMNAQELEANPLTASEGRTYAYRDTVRRMNLTAPAAELELIPQMNIAFTETKLSAENPLIQLVGKMNFADYEIFKANDGSYKVTSEIGYMELGGRLKFALVPGEVTPGIVTGKNDALGENVLSLKNYAYKPLESVAGEGVYVFGLCNDAIGYIIPENDFILFHNILNSKLFYKLLGYNYTHYQELLSLGKDSAGTLSEDFEKLVNSVK